MIHEFNFQFWEKDVIDICDWIDATIKRYPAEERETVSTDAIKRLRDLINAVCVCCLLKNKPQTFKNQYDYVVQGLKYVEANKNYKFIYDFYKRSKISLSHYSPFGEEAERLMLRYCENLLHLKNYLKNEFGLDVLHELDRFPMDLDETFEIYYLEIIKAMQSIVFDDRSSTGGDLYYVQKKKTIYCQNVLFYEYTLSNANDGLSKFDRFTAFSKIDVFDNYAIKASFLKKPVSLFGVNVYLNFLTDYQVAIRPCEFGRLLQIIGITLKSTFSPGKEYYRLLSYIQECKAPLDELLIADKYDFKHLLDTIHITKESYLYLFLTKSRRILLSDQIGKNVYKYLLRTINNRILKEQMPLSGYSSILSDEIRVRKADSLFDGMPYVFSLVKHNPRFETLLDCFPLAEHEDEMIKRWVNKMSLDKSVLYNQIPGETTFEKIEESVRRFNALCNEKGFKDEYKLQFFKKYIYENGTEQTCHKLIKKLLDLAKCSNVPDFTSYIQSRIEEIGFEIDDSQKRSALKTMYKNGSLFAIYGCAGSGKSTFASYLLKILGKEAKVLCLTNTNPALMNLRKKLGEERAQYFTTYRFLRLKEENVPDCDFLIVDECSNISNTDMLAVLEKAHFKLLLLLGDVHQIESIQFGNWYSLLFRFLSDTEKIELVSAYRAQKNEHLLDLWKAVRENDDSIFELFEKYKVSKKLGDELFETSSSDEVILCLNYDGLYGLNNINNYLQTRNPNPAVYWKQYTFKKGDPILFIENSRFGSLLYNNLKGKIDEVEKDEKGNLHFKIVVNRSVNPFDRLEGLELIKNFGDGRSLIAFSVRNPKDTDYENDMKEDCKIPFQIAYAVSIHKAQGLEYDSVKIVITNEVEELITHNIFYTAITRAKNDLTVYWTPESERKIIKSLQIRNNASDFSILQNKFSDLRR